MKTNISSSELEDNLLSSRYKAATDFIELKVPRRILNSPNIVAAVNRHKLFPNAFNIFAGIAKASGDNVNNFVLNTSTRAGSLKKFALICLMKSRKTKALVKDEFVSIQNCNMLKCNKVSSFLN